ncbi:hypothetical protein [Lactobacillus sp. ESL0230]|uniref:hypothetical protein n=1 Tax=Lactobacillus sp. ESL0230 TaxID=2069353 RepID=UPI000EFAF8F3|nr:hypothetical protein [Lactobacillus sp. ESL0230]RMC46721.1 hypothetical protein F5ESL0230_05575 [Lactobacillus sp. ESL0230]
MKEYLYLRLKKISPLFIIPIGIEVIFFLIRMNNIHNSTASEFHGLWYAAAAAIILFVTTYQLIKIYYVGNDELINILPYSNELLTFIELLIYVLATTIFGTIYQLINIYKSGVKFNIIQYFGDKFLSLFSFYMLLLAFCTIFKNVRKAALGESLIIFATFLVIVCEILLFWNVEKSRIVHFILGITSPSSDIFVVYLNVLPYSFFGESATAIKIMTNFSYLLNIITSVISSLIVIFWKRIIKLNYMNLVG